MSNLDKDTPRYIKQKSSIELEDLIRNSYDSEYKILFLILLELMERNKNIAQR